MNAMTRRIVIGTAAVSMAVSLAACGKAGDDKDSGSGGDSKTIGLLLPENKTTRYETFDRPMIEAKIKALCSDCDVKYNNAGGDAETQKKQFDALVTQGIKVIVLDTVDYKAAKSWIQQADKKGVKVVAYDRLAEGPISAYISYDNEKIGRLQGEALVKALGDKAKSSNVVMINGSPLDPNAPSSRRARTASWTPRSRRSSTSRTSRTGRRTRRTRRWVPPSTRWARRASRASTPRTTAWPVASSPPSRSRA